MNKTRAPVFLIVMLVLALTAIVLSACGAAPKLYFATDGEYIAVYLDGETTITPALSVRPKSADYTLRSSNSAIITVGENGKSITANKEGIATLTAVSGEAETSIKVVVYTAKASSAVKTSDDGKVVVHFYTYYGTLPDQRVTPGECVRDPGTIDRPGYVLSGWYTDTTFETPFDLSTPIYKKTTLYAYWLPGEPYFNFGYRETGENRVTFVNGLLYPYIDYEEITLPQADAQGNPVTQVRLRSFEGNSHVKRIIIPSSYTSMEEYAFASCTGVTEIVFDGAVITDCGEYAFANCPKLSSVRFINGGYIRNVGPYSFSGCSALTAIALPENTMEIGVKAFGECQKLAALDLPDSLVKIGAFAFYGCTSLPSVDLNKVQEIGNEAFWGATSLTAVSGGESVTKMGSYVFGSLIAQFSAQSAPWLLSAGEKPAGDTTKSVYLGKTLVYVHPSSTKAIITVKIGTTLIAAQACEDLTDGIVYFNDTEAPARGQYAFGGSQTDKPDVDIVVRESSWDNFLSGLAETVQSGNQYSVTEYTKNLAKQLYVYVYPVSGVDIFYRHPVSFVKTATPGASFTRDDSKINIVLNDYSGTGETLDATQIVYDFAKGKQITDWTNITVDKIKAYFLQSPNSGELKTVYFPNRIGKIESVGISFCTKLEALKIDVVDEGFSPGATTLSANSINVSGMPNTFLLYVLGSQDIRNALQGAWVNSGNVTLKSDTTVIKAAPRTIS